MDSMLCFRQAQILNRARKGHKARLLTETSGMAVFAVCHLPSGARGRRRSLPSRCGRNFEPNHKKDFVKKDFEEGFSRLTDLEQELTGESADERRSHHRVARRIELFDQLLLRHRWRVPRNGDRRDIPVDDLRPLR